MESEVVNSDVRKLCEAVSEEPNPEQMMLLVDELIRVLDERQQRHSLTVSSSRDLV